MLRNREGFTLIELLIVVVIIGILAAIALPKFGQTREQAYLTTMKSDLSNLRTAQEMYYQTQGTFSYAPDGEAALDFSESSGVNVTIVQNDQEGWAATATHDALPSVTCAIEFGNPPGTNGVFALSQVGAPECNN